MAADKSFSTKDKSVGSEVGGCGGKGYKRNEEEGKRLCMSGTNPPG